ncbi:MAG TPA: alkaline phosphatase family protein [Clostridia bacterium]|nr:alkaline phosphatase family protein [Clostridia bacterium]
MIRIFSFFLLAGALVLSGCGGDNGNGGSGSNSTPATQAALKQNVNHIIFMFQENRSFDSYFGQLNAYRTANGFGADVDGLDRVVNPSNKTRDGSSTIASFKLLTACTENVSPAWSESHVQRNRNTPDITNPATMDGFVLSAAGYAAANGLNDLVGQRAMGYYDQDVLPFYYFMATNFATSDRWFSPVLSKTEPNRLFGLAATSDGWTAVPQAVLSQKTIFHLIQDAGVTWKVYTTDPGLTFLTYFQPFATNHADKIVPVSQYFTDLNNGTLPSVVLIEGGYSSGLDEHPKNNVQTGAAHVARLLDALMKSSSWKDSVFLLTYDEGGGLYDHVPPAPAANPDGIAPKLQGETITNFADNFSMTGFRVPLIVISPFTRKGYVSHATADFTAILKFIEMRFDLPNLNARDAAQPDMLEFFDFSNPPWATPPQLPAQPVSAPCYFNALP